MQNTGLCFDTKMYLFNLNLNTVLHIYSISSMMYWELATSLPPLSSSRPLLCVFHLAAA